MQCDVSHGDAEAQSGDVRDVLKELGIDPDSGKLIEVWNKLDALDENERERVQNSAARRPEDERPSVVSALTGEGMEALLSAIDRRLGSAHVSMHYDIAIEDGAKLAWLYRPPCPAASREPGYPPIQPARPGRARRAWRLSH